MIYDTANYNDNNNVLDWLQAAYSDFVATSAKAIRDFKISCQELSEALASCVVHCRNIW